MRKMICAALAAMLCLCWAASAEAGLRADAVSPKEGGAYLRAEGKLIEIMGDEAALLTETSGKGVMAKDGAAYYLETGADGVPRLKRCEQGAAPEEAFVFSAGDTVTNLTSQDGELFVLLNGLMHVVYPSNGMCIKLANTPMTEFLWLDGKAYCVASERVVPYSRASTKGTGEVKGDAGFLYEYDMNTGEMDPLLQTGVSDVRTAGGWLYYHDLSDNYVMESANGEVLKGRLYRVKPADKQPERVLEGYDWDYYPTSSGVAVYTAEGVYFYAADGGVTELLRPKGLVSGAGAEDAVYLYDHAENRLYRYDGTYMYALAEAALAAVMDAQ